MVRLLEEELLDRARAGSKESWDELVEIHYHAIVRYVQQVMRDQDLAYETAAEVFLTARVALPKLTDYGLRPWLFAIAKNLCRRCRRSLSHHQRLFSFNSQVNLDWSVGQVTSSSLAEVLDDSSKVSGVLAQLSDKARAVLIWRFVHDMSVEEIAAQLEVSPAAVYKRLSRAREQFRVTYERVG